MRVFQATAPRARFGTDVIAFADPDRMRVELVGEATDARWQVWEEGPVAPEHQIRSFHAVTAFPNRREGPR